MPVLTPDAPPVPSSRPSCLCSLQYFVGLLVSSALKWQELSLALKSKQLGAVRTHTDFPVAQLLCPVCSRDGPLPTTWESSAFQEQVAKPGAE